VVIEHSFVTTMEAPQTMQLAMQFLASRGFRRSEQIAFPVGGGEWNTLEMRRGRKKAARAKNVTELPQVAHVQFDRGRVTVALSIEPSARWGGAQVSFGITVGSVEGKPKKMKLHAQLLTAIANGLEQVLTRGATVDEAAQEWDQADQAARAEARRRFRNSMIVLFVVIALFATGIALIINYAK